MATPAPPRIFRRQGSASAIHIWIRNTTANSRSRRLDDACSSVSSLSTAAHMVEASSFYSACTQNTTTDDDENDDDDSDCSCGSDFRFDTNLEVDDDDDDDSNSDNDDDDSTSSHGSASLDLEQILPAGLKDIIRHGKDQEQPIDNNASTTNNRHDSAADLRWESTPNLECCLMLLNNNEPTAAAPLVVADDDTPPHLPPRQASSNGGKFNVKHPAMSSSNNNSNHSNNYSNHKLRLMAGTATKQAQRRITKILRSGLQRPRMPRRQLSNASSKLLGSVATLKQKKKQQQKTAEPSPQDVLPEGDAGAALTTLLSKESTATDETSPESAHTEESQRSQEEQLMSGVGKTPRATLSERLRRFPLDVPAMNLSKKSSTQSKSSCSSRGDKKNTKKPSSIASGKSSITKTVTTAPATSPCRRKLPTRAGQPRIQRLVRRSQLLDAAAAAAAAAPRRSTVPATTGRSLPRNSAWRRRRSYGPNPPPRLSSTGQRRAALEAPPQAIVAEAATAAI